MKKSDIHIQLQSHDGWKSTWRLRKTSHQRRLHLSAGGVITGFTLTSVSSFSSDQNTIRSLPVAMGAVVAETPKTWRRIALQAFVRESDLDLELETRDVVVYLIVKTKVI